MSYKKSLCFFISDSRKFLKFYSLIQLAIVYLHINFQSRKYQLYSFVYFHFRYSLLSNNNSNMNETVKIHKRCHDLLNYTIRIAFIQAVFLEMQTSCYKIAQNTHRQKRTYKI